MMSTALSFLPPACLSVCLTKHRPIHPPIYGSINKPSNTVIFNLTWFFFLTHFRLAHRSVLRIPRFSFKLTKSSLVVMLCYYLRSCLLERCSQHFCIKENASLRDLDTRLLLSRNVRKTLNYGDVGRCWHTCFIAYWVTPKQFYFQFRKILRHHVVHSLLISLESIPDSRVP